MTMQINRIPAVPVETCRTRFGARMSSCTHSSKGTVLVKSKDVGLHRSFEVLLFSNPYGSHQAVLFGFILTQDRPTTPTTTRSVSSCLRITSQRTRHVESPTASPTARAAPSLAMAARPFPFSERLVRLSCSSFQTQTPLDPDSCGYDVPQFNQYTRVHRDRAVVDAMRAWLGLPTGLSNEQIGLPTSCSSQA